MAKSINPFDQDTHPPFAGFSKETVKFLRALAANNNREWFQENKDLYEEAVKEPMISLLTTLSQRIVTIDPDILIEPKKSMYRIYRDIRFSKDKTPYKTHAAAAFTFSGLNRKQDASFYFHFSPKEVGVGGGLYSPDGPRLKNLRKAIAQNPDELRSIITARPFVKYFGEMTGESLQRVPRGYDKDDPAEDLLRRKQFLSWADLPVSSLMSADLADVLLKHFKAMAPFIRYLADHS